MMASINSLPKEIIAEIVSLLDYPDQLNAYYACRMLYQSRPFVISPGFASQLKWLWNREGALNIPRQELLRHNAFLRIVTRTYTTIRPSERVLDALVAIFTQELISAWMFPTDLHGKEERTNHSLDDYRIYHQRYPLLQRLAMILRWNGTGPRIAFNIQQWLDTKWAEIKNEDEIQVLLNQDYHSQPPQFDLQDHQEKILVGFQYLALFPIHYFAPAGVPFDTVDSRFQDEGWRHPGFNKLKLWLSIPELWNIEIRHLELYDLLNPYRQFRRIAARPVVHLILYRSAAYECFSLRILSFMRSIELATPFPELIRGARYWYEEGYCGCVTLWASNRWKFPGQYISLFRKPFLDLINGYIKIFGPSTLSDLILNIVFFVHQKTQAVRVIVARAMMNKLLFSGYQYLTDDAREAILDLMRERGEIITRQLQYRSTLEAAAERGDPTSRGRRKGNSSATKVSW